MNTPTKLSSPSLFKLSSLLIVLAAFATRHAFADFDTLYVAGLAVVALWIMQAQEAAPGSGWGWARAFIGGTALPVHGLLLAGIVAGPAIFTKRDKETAPHFVSTAVRPPVPASASAGGCGSGGCGGSAGGCSGGGGGGAAGGCGSGAGGCGAGASCGGGSTVAAHQPGVAQRSSVAMASSQPRPGFFSVPQASASHPGNVPSAAFSSMPQAARPGQPGVAPAMAPRPTVQPFSSTRVTQVNAPMPASAVSPTTPVAALPTPALAAVPAPQTTPPAPVSVASTPPSVAPAPAPQLGPQPSVSDGNSLPATEATGPASPSK